LLVAGDEIAGSRRPPGERRTFGQPSVPALASAVAEEDLAGRDGRVLGAGRPRGRPLPRRLLGLPRPPVPHPLAAPRLEGAQPPGLLLRRARRLDRRERGAA